MDALSLRSCFLVRMTVTVTLCFAAAAFDGVAASAAEFSTKNFVVHAASDEIAETIGCRSEELRREIAVYWFGKPLPNWSRPCRMRVRVSSRGLGAGGQTTFQFVRGEVLNWNMSVQGSLERILDSVLPHEINHTIFACHFRRPLPRWADEGAATLFEHRSEQLKQLALLKDVIRRDDERISLEKLLTMKEYPSEMRPMLILYAQGYALADFLVQQKGKAAYLQFLADGEKLGWNEAIRRNFDHEGVASLEHNWKSWVIAGMPLLEFPTDQMLTAATTARATREMEVATPAPEPPPRKPAPSVRGIGTTALEPTGATITTVKNSLRKSDVFQAHFGISPRAAVHDPDSSSHADWARFPHQKPDRVPDTAD